MSAKISIPGGNGRMGKTLIKEIIENEKAAAISELKNSVGALSIEIAEKVLKSELKDVEKQNTFISEMLKDVKLN